MRRIAGRAILPAAGFQPARWSWLPAACLTLLLTDCGYIGQPLPPALRRPVIVSDLGVVQRGSKIIIHFTIPKVTTEDLPLNGNEDIELRIGLPNSDMAAWQRTAERIPVSPRESAASVEWPASKWYGKTVSIAVNVHGPTGHSAGWSRPENLPVVPALPKPEALTAANAPDVVHLEWHAGAPEFRVFRRLQGDSNWNQIGTSNTPSYTDGTMEYGKAYQYMVQSDQKIDTRYAESDLSDVVSIKPVDTFPPAVPAGLSPVPGSRSIELVWERNTEKDFAGYRVYRDGQKIAEGLTAPAFSDRDAKQGVKYQYQVSAVDNAGNESAKSPAVESMIP
jgi:hypothetical protein